MNAEKVAIEVSELSKVVSDSSGDLVILDRLNFEVSAGETVAIIGASGSGKSTLLGLLAGLDTPSSGQIRLFGQNIVAFDEEARAKFRAHHLAFVFQSFQLLGHLTALENVMLALELRGDAQAEPAARAMLQAVGLQNRLHHYPKTLSGGEQQRVALARAFVVQPRLLLADEPTGSLDTATGLTIIDLMFALNQQAGSTLVLVTHDPSIAARCHRTLQLNGQGGLIETALTRSGLPKSNENVELA